MAYTHHERLSALDLSFLQIEDRNIHMHVGAVALFEPGPLGTPDGGIGIDHIRQGVNALLGESPRFRQKLAEIPVADTPVWIDDEHFNLLYHVRHTALPKPGSIRQLKRLTGRIMSQKLERSKPMWEFWFVEGLEDGRFAMIAKAHHCLVDGIAGFDLLARMMRFEPDPTIEPANPWIPRPAPKGAKLLRDEVLHRAALPLQVLGAGAQLLTAPRESLAQLRQASGAVWEALSANLRPSSPTPLNVEIGPYRRFDWARFELDAVKEVKNRLGGTVNDVVLACVSGAVARFLKLRGERVSDLRFRSLVPVSVRGSPEAGREGNRVASLLAELPIAEVDPRKRLAAVAETTRRLKSSRQAQGIQIFERIADRGLHGVFIEIARLAASRITYNLVVTNIPGPQRPAWFLGAKMQEIYPLVPLFTNQALGTALLSYDGSLTWGFNADWDAMPDLHDFVNWVEREFESLRKAAGGERIGSAGARPEPGAAKSGARAGKRSGSRPSGSDGAA